MPRADPTRSRYCATRHLLRNLRRPRALRRNPLTCEGVAERVDAALRTIDAKHAAILLRVDVERHDPRVVAADLGFSLRQFHRARRAAHDRFYTAYRAEPPAVAASVNEAFTPRLLARAASLADSGETASAAAILDDIASNACDDAARVEALVRLAESDAWSHRLSRARRQLEAARSVLTASILDDDRAAQLQDSWEAVSLTLQWFERGPSAIRRAPAGPNGRATLVRAAAALHVGEAAYATDLLRRIDRSSPGLRAPEAIVDLLMLQAELEDFNAANPLHSEQLFAHAAATAREHGLRGRELYASHQLSVTRWARTREAHDRGTYRALVDRIDRSLPARLRSYLIASAADAELAMGHPRRALIASKTAAALSTNRYESFSANAMAAGALFRLRRIDEAGVAAAMAADAARAEGHARVLSLAQRISAQAHLARGERRAARSAIAESIECARYFSSAYAFAAARAVLAQIVGR